MTDHDAQEAVLASILGLFLTLFLGASLHAQDPGQQDPEKAEPAAPRSATTIVREFRNTHLPSRSKGNSPEAVREFREAIGRACQRQADLALELYRGWPDHLLVPDFLNKRWAGMNNALGKANKVLEETLDLIKKETRPAILREAVVAATRSALLLDRVSTEQKLEIAETACEIAPHDERGPLALVEIAKYHVADVDQIRKFCQKVVKGWGDTQWAGSAARRVQKQLERIGQKPRLDFRDVVSGKLIDTSRWRGQPYVIMLWGGFHGSSAKALEEIRIYRSKHPFRIVGIYTWKHKGGTDSLRADLKRRHYDWPQAYTYKPGQSPWKGAWGTSEVPLFFLVDAQGTIVSLSYRFKNIQKAMLARTKPKQKSVHKKSPAKKRRKL